MTRRIANINMMHRAALGGMEAGIRETFGIEEREYHDDIIYSAMIQAGVQRFRVAGDIPKNLKNSNLLSYRFEESSFEDINNIMSSVKEFLGFEKIPKKDQSEIWILAWYLTELIHSSQTKSSMVSILRIPKMSDLAGKISPAAFSAIDGLLKNIENIDLNLPVTKLEAPLRDVEIFHEIVSSNVFGSYSEAQELIEYSSENKEAVKLEISRKGKEFYNRFHSVLDIRKASLTLIPVTSSLIETVFGRFPGKIASAFGDSLASSLADKRRITIYNYGDTHAKLLTDYYMAKAIVIPPENNRYFK